MRENKDQKNSEYGHFSYSVRDEAFEMQLSFHVHKLDLPLWSALKLLLSNCSCKKSKNKFLLPYYPKTTSKEINANSKN